MTSVLNYQGLHQGSLANVLVVLAEFRLTRQAHDLSLLEWRRGKNHAEMNKPQVEAKLKRKSGKGVQDVE